MFDGNTALAIWVIEEDRFSPVVAKDSEPVLRSAQRLNLVRREPSQSAQHSDAGRVKPFSGKPFVLSGIRFDYSHVSALPGQSVCGKATYGTSTNDRH